MAVELFALPDFIGRGPGYKSVYYGINNIRPIYSERVHRVLRFVLIGPTLNKIQPFKNFKICKKMYGFPDKCPAIHTFVIKFLRF